MNAPVARTAPVWEDYVWDVLLAAIAKHRVIPVIGPALSLVEVDGGAADDGAGAGAPCVWKAPMSTLLAGRGSPRWSVVGTVTPVMVELRIRACHVSGSFTARDNVRPAFTLRDALDHPVRDTSRIVLPPASYLHEKEKIEKRWPAADPEMAPRKRNQRGSSRNAVGSTSARTIDCA